MVGGVRISLKVKYLIRELGLKFIIKDYQVLQFILHKETSQPI